MNYLPAYLLVLLLSWEQAAPPSVLRFDWPTSTSARVETDYLRQSGDGQEEHLRITHVMRVLPHTDGRLIESTNPKYVDSSGSLEQSLSALLSEWIPRKIVNNEGLFLRAEETEGLQQIVSDMFESQLRTSPAQMLPAFRDYVKRMTSGNALTMIAASNWDQLVGRWIGMAIIPKMLEGKGSIGISPGLEVPATITTGLVQRVPCPRGGEDHECGIYEFK